MGRIISTFTFSPSFSPGIHFEKPEEKVVIIITDLRGKKLMEQHYLETTDYIHLDLNYL